MCLGVGVHVRTHTSAGAGAVVAVGGGGQEAAEGVSLWDEPQRPWDPRVLNTLGKASPPFPERSWGRACASPEGRSRQLSARLVGLVALWRC